MATLIQNMAGMGDMSEQVIATDLLISTKNAIKTYASAISETTSPQISSTLRRQLDDTISLHEKISTYMMQKGYYNAYDPTAQLSMDKEVSDTVLNKTF